MTIPRKRLRECRGCAEHGWLGLVDGSTGKRYHERSTTPGQSEVIACTRDAGK